jgi:hypothetical protein
MRWERVLCIAFVLLGASRARAGVQTIACELVEPGYVQIDGMLDDWRDLRPRSIGTGDDRRLAVRCAHDQERLHLAIDVRDELVVRSGRPGRHDDHLRLAIGAGTPPVQLRLYPGTRGVRALRTLGDAPAPAWVGAEDSLQQSGWSVELDLPLARLPGWGKGTPAFDAVIEYSDGDRPGSSEGQVSFTGRLGMAHGRQAFRAFWAAASLGRSSVRLDALADIDAAAGAERVVVAGTRIGVVSDEFTYLQLPVSSAADLLDVRLVDFDGAGKSMILTQLRQHGNGGSRDLVALWTIQGDGSFARPLAFEVRKELAGRVLANRWSLIPRAEPGKRRKRGRGGGGERGLDVLVEVAEVSGWDQLSFREEPARDVRPILTPWGQKRARYRVVGDTAVAEE